MCSKNDKIFNKREDKTYKIAIVSCGYPDKNYRVKSIFTHEQVLYLKKLGVIVDVYDTFADSTLFPDFMMDYFENVPYIGCLQHFGLSTPIS